MLAPGSFCHMQEVVFIHRNRRRPADYERWTDEGYALRSDERQRPTVSRFSNRIFPRVHMGTSQ